MGGATRQPGAATHPLTTAAPRDYPVDIAAHGTSLTLTAAGQDPAELLPLPGGRYRLPPARLRDHLRPRRPARHAYPPGRHHPDGNPLTLTPTRITRVPRPR